MTFKVVGQAHGRKDGVPKVTGAAEYAIDVSMPRLLHAKVLRSPYPHARVNAIDTSLAEAVPGVRAILTGAELGAYLMGNRVRDMPILAASEVRHIGEKVAAVAADDDETAARACNLIKVDYTQLPAFFTAEEALLPQSALVHPLMGSYQGYMHPPSEPSNVFFSDSYGVGAIEEGFKMADHIFEDTYFTQRQHPVFFEPRVCVVDADRDGRIHIWTSTKAPHGLKGMVAAAIKREPEDIVINPTFAGGDFGGKGCPWDEPLAYFLSLRTGRPVRIAMDYQEELSSGNPRHASKITVRTGVTSAGEITAHYQDMVFNSGAYAALMPLGYLAGADRIASNLRIPHARFDHRHVYSNTVPGGYMRGPGEVQGTFALESHMDEIAIRMGIDPIEFRRKNILREGDLTPMGETFSGVRAEETLLAAVEASGFRRSSPPNVGMGIAMCARPAGPGETHAEVRIDRQGRVRVRTPIFEQGSGTYTVLGQIVAEELGTSFDNVDVEPWDTDAVPFDSGVAGSRTIRMVGPAAHEAATKALEELIGIAAELTGWPVEDIRSSDSCVLNDRTQASISWAELLSRVPDKVVIGMANSKQVGLPQYTTFVAQVAEIKVDSETGQLEVLRFLTVHDVGMVLNPIGHQGQINGSIITGFGFSLMEDLAIENGKVLTTSLAEFKIPTTADIPPLQTVLLESDQGDGPYKIRSIGEAPLLGVAPAIANALRDAIGIRLYELPLTPEKILRAIQSA